MSKQREILDKILNPKPLIQVWEAEVLSVQAKTCTVSLIASNLEIEDVRLSADSQASNGLVLKPKVGSIVLVGCVFNQLSDLFVVQYAEIESLTYTQNGNTIRSDSSGVLLKNDSVEIELASGKVGIKNAGTDLKTLFGDLITLLNGFVVITSQGPSTAVSPTTLSSIAQLQTKVNSLLK